MSDRLSVLFCECFSTKGYIPLGKRLHALMHADRAHTHIQARRSLAVTGSNFAPAPTPRGTNQGVSMMLRHDRHALSRSAPCYITLRPQSSDILCFPKTTTWWQAGETTHLSRRLSTNRQAGNKNNMSRVQGLELPSCSHASAVSRTSP